MKTYVDFYPDSRGAWRWEAKRKGKVIGASRDGRLHLFQAHRDFVQLVSGAGSGEIVLMARRKGKRVFVQHGLEWQNGCPVI